MSILRRETDLRARVVLVDDGSTDGTAEAVQRAVPDVEIVRGTGDLYWAGGMRLAIAVARQQGHPDILLMINDDFEADDEGVAMSLRCFRQLRRRGERVFLVGAIEDAARPGQPAYSGMRRRSFWNPLALERVVPDGTLQPVDTGNGNFVLLCSGTLALLGNIAEGYRHAIGDVCLGYRATRQGSPVRLLPRYVGRGFRNDHLERVLAQGDLAARARAFWGPKGDPLGFLRFYRRHGGRWWPILLALDWIRRLCGTFAPELYLRLFGGPRADEARGRE
jgi:glycosyltransferase involved in cell wall biosynthesis